MALVKAGWFQTTWFPSRWWQEDYWLEYGAATPPIGGDSSYYYFPLKKRVPKSNRELLSKIKVLLEQIRG